MRRAIALVLAAAAVLVAALLVPTAPERETPLVPRPSPPLAGETDPGHGGGFPRGGDERASEPHRAARGLDPADCARPVIGLVRARSGQAIAGARVQLVLECGGETRGRAEAISDAGGRFVADLPEALELSPLELALAEVRFSAEAKGFQPARAVRPLAQIEARAAPRGEEPVVLVLDPGGRLAGRVVDREGRAVHDALVLLVVEGRLPGRPALSAADRARTRRDGGFELGYVSSGKVSLHARKDGLGSARVELDLEAAAEVVLDDLVLRGAGVLAGRVLYPDGTPVRRFELCAVPAELADRNDPRPEAELGMLEREEGRGLSFARATTDLEGRFRIEGLAEGRYALAPEEPELALGPRGPFASGAEALVLELAVPRLRVYVRDEGGRPLRGATVIATELVPGGDGALAPGRAQHALSAGAQASVSFPVEPRARLALRALVPRGPFVDEIVELAAGEWELERTLVLPDRPATGRLRLDARGPSGERVPIATSVTPAAGGLPLANAGSLLVPDEDGWLPPLPAGRWRLELRPLAESGGPIRHLAPRTAPEVEIVPGMDAFLPLELPLGARIVLALELPAGHELGREDPEDELYGEVTKSRRAARRLRERGASATLARETREPGEPEAVPRSLHFEPPSGGRGGLESKLLPGREAFVHEVLEPGAWRLVVEAEGFAPLETSLVLAPGEVRRVVLALEPDRR